MRLQINKLEFDELGCLSLRSHQRMTEFGFIPGLGFYLQLGFLTPTSTKLNVLYPNIRRKSKVMEGPQERAFVSVAFVSFVLDKV